MFEVMMTPELIVAKIQKTLPGAQVAVDDLTGTQDHFRVAIVAREFADRTMIQQHQMIYKILHQDMEANGGGIHALSLDTMTPGQWEQRKTK